MNDFSLCENMFIRWNDLLIVALHKQIYFHADLS